MASTNACLNQLGQLTAAGSFPHSAVTKKEKKNSVRRLTIGAWNVRTLLDRTGTSRPERRGALVDRELSRYKVDIAALSETRYACTGQETEKTYTFFWSGKSEKEKRESGVGFAIKTKSRAERRRL